MGAEVEDFFASSAVYNWISLFELEIAKRERESSDTRERVNRSERRTYPNNSQTAISSLDSGFHHFHLSAFSVSRKLLRYPHLHGFWNESEDGIWDEFIR